MLVHLWPCENRPVFLQKYVGDLLVGGDFNFFFLFFSVPACCRRSKQHQLSLLYLCYMAGSSDRTL